MQARHSVRQKRKSSTTRTQSLRAGIHWDHVEIAFRIALVEVRRRRNHTFSKSEDSCDGLQSARCSQRVTVHGFGGAHRYCIPETRDRIAAVSVRIVCSCPCAVRVE